MTDTLASLPRMGWKREDKPLRGPEITQTHKDEFIQLILDGLPPELAAHQVGTTLTVLKRLRRPGATYYDAAFEQAVEDALESHQHKRGRLELLRGLQWQRALAGDTRMIEKLSLNYDPDWEHLRHTNFRIDIRAEFAKTYATLTTAELERLAEAHEAAEQRQLQAHPDIEAK